MSTSASLQVFQLMKIKILQAMVNIFIVVTIDIEMQLFINIVSISTRMKVFLFNKQVE
jgi:hypothetical protein